jgi:hypothetical protein
MAKEIFPKSQLPVRKTAELLPRLFRTEANSKFMAGAVDPLVQPGVLEKTVGYIGRRFGKTYNTKDIYLDTDETLRSTYQLEPGVVVKNNGSVENFYDYLDFKNQLRFFENNLERDDLITSQDHYSWNPPIDWDKFVNFREYYWIPEGPPSIRILGELQPITSTYKVVTGVGSVFIFSPDGLTNNPTLTLYRGQTYKFRVNVPGDGFVIRRALDTGSSLYNPILPYNKNQIVVFDGKVYQAKETISTQANPIPLDQDSRWEQLDSVSQNTFLDYNLGVENNGTENGTVTITVPYDAPDVLFYQSFTDPNKFGRFIIGSIDTNTRLDVEAEIIGKATYKSSNGIEFSNGMVLRFEGQVVPEKYSRDTWLVEGVGNRITLTRFLDLIVSPLLTVNAPDILFDDAGFDSQPFDDASSYPVSKDYLTISKSSIDSNPWSRYNRWFHKSVLEFAHDLNQSSFDAPETARAKRPIIEFKPHLQLFNHGSIAKSPVDYVDDFTTDIFSTVEGSQGFIVDGESLFEGARLLVTADTDSLVNNKIYTVKFIVHNGRRQISLIKSDDSESMVGEGVLIRRGKTYQGLMFHYNGNKWIQSQTKISANQSPLFDVFDENEISFGNLDTYPVSTFIGSELVSYKIGTGFVDSELGFSLSYLNIDNVGDIQFEFDFENDEFNYESNQTVLSKKVSTGFYKFNLDTGYENGWIKTDPTYLQPIIETVNITETTNQFASSAAKWRTVSDDKITKILFYLNGIQIKDSYDREKNIFKFDRTFKEGDVVVLKIFADVEPDTGYYEIPLGLEKNPLNENITTFTLGQAADHVLTALEFVDEFTGIFPGNNNLRDLNDYQNLSKRFLKHSGLTPLSILLLCDKDINIVKSIQYSKQAYSEFKNTFLKLAEDLFYNQDPVAHVDLILEEISRSKNSESPFFETDMVGSGAYTQIDYTVEDEGIKTFALSEKFDLDTLSNRAIYAYVNNQQLIFEKDYEFNSTFGFINFKIDLKEGDKLVIREYVSTSNNFIPPTPTKLGLYKKFLPQLFLDDTYVESREVIQGHDGSITAAFGDYRDEVLLELEFRIYNNIKQKYDTKIFDNDAILGGYYNSSVYNKSQADSILITDFLRWVSKTNVDYVNNDFFDSENPFTYTYSNMTDPTGKVNLPGYWRGVYHWFYDTDRPHRCPWEMLGFSQQPDWWESVYGPAPYTSNNLILWEDLRDGIIRQGERAGTYDRYKRSSILNHIPVDGDGNLLDPLTSGLAGNFVLINNRGNFKFGDISPVEYAWRSSSEYPFAVISAFCLLKPFEYISDNFNKSLTTVNKVGQTVNADTDLFFKLSDVVSVQTTENNISGLYLYVVNYVKSRSFEPQSIDSKIQNIDVLLSNRISGFVDQQQQKYLLDSKNPKSTASSIFIPPENYDIIFDVSCPILNVTYSGVVLEKVNTGWKIEGYDALNPFFRYFKSSTSQSDPLIRVGGVSETFVEWTSGRFYGNGVVARYLNEFYRSVRSHTSEDTFDTSLWRKLPDLPVVGAVEAVRRRNFNRLKTQTIPYGYIFNTVQDVVDFLLGYYEYQQSAGIVFSGYDTETQTAFDWVTSVKEFLFWTKHNWAVGSLISLSPLANRVEITTSVGVADNILDSFYDYQILKNDGTPLDPNFVDVSRDFQKITVSTTNTTEGIFFLKIYFVLKEHVVLFDDRTVFNDVIYDKPTGYRQDRIKVRGFRTVDWDGDYTSPGFIFDNVNISAWQPFVDYRLGDIASYRSILWTSNSNQLGSDTFNPNNWSKLDLIPSKGLISNFDYKIDQFSDFFEVESDGLGSSQREMARHSLGYQKRDYLQDLAEDEVTQFRLYQGFIREKGTNNAVTKVFDKLSRANQAGVRLNEEWAFRVGRFGGVDQNSNYEFRLNRSDFEINPQPIFIEAVAPVNNTDQFLRVTGKDFLLSPGSFTTEINPKKFYNGPSRNAGYVNLNDVNFTLPTRDDILTLSIFLVLDNDHFWITFDNSSWTVLRYNEQPGLSIVTIDTDQDRVTLTIDKPHNLRTGDIIGIRQIQGLTGFYKIQSSTRNTFTVIRSETGPELELKDSVFSLLGTFTEVRYPNYNATSDQTIALLKEGAKLWIDKNSKNNWEVIEKTKRFVLNEVLNYGIQDPKRIGTSVVYTETLKQIITGVPGSRLVLAFSDRSSNTNTNANLGLKQIISPPLSLETAVEGTFGEVLAVSPDEQWLVIGSPSATGVSSRYRGMYNTLNSYTVGDIVLDQFGKLWEAVNFIPAGDGSTLVSPDLSLQDWKPASIVLHNPAGSNLGYLNQGAVTLYRYDSGIWISDVTIVSPRQSNNEFFGSAISIGVSGSNYYMAVSAKGSLGDKGRVYLFYYTGTEWTMLKNSNYVGLFDSSKTYPLTSIVWYENSLYQAVVELTNIGDDVTDSPNWIKIDPVSTSNSLPTAAAINDDGSTLGMGLLNSDQLAELIKEGDGYGYSIAMNRDASTLVISAPFSDGQFYNSFKGLWKSYQDYFENDIVRFQNAYYKLIDIDNADSVYTSKNELPSNGLPWQLVDTDSGNFASGKVFIYRRDANQIYSLVQTINTQSLQEISDIGAGNTISSGDQFGFAVDIDWAGTTIVVSSPQADINFQNQGSVYVFELNSETETYRLVQVLQSFENYGNELFGSSVSISSGTEKIAVGAKNSPFYERCLFNTFNEYTRLYDNLDYPTYIPTTNARPAERATAFDFGTTTFSDFRGYSGNAYVFEKKISGYLLTEKLQDKLKANEAFGFSIDCANNTVVVGSPFYTSDSGDPIGKIRLFKSFEDSSGLKIIRQETELVDIESLVDIELYDEENNFKIEDIDVIDYYKLKILNLAEQELSFKTVYDPAVYSFGTEEQVVDPDQAWFEKNVGKLWWDLSTVKFLNYEQGDISYKIGNWSNQVDGSSIDVYEWVESTLLPSEWNELADTTEGLASGISGEAKFSDDTVFNRKVKINSNTGLINGTLYYYWVKNSSIIQAKAKNRSISAVGVAGLIENPIGSNIPFIGIVDSDKFLAFNLKDTLVSDSALLNIQYKKSNGRINNVHNEYQLLTEGVADSLPSETLERKWIDSLLGVDSAGNRVPDTDLPIKTRYGLSFRPRQSMFVDKFKALEIVVNNINSILLQRPFSDLIDFTNFNDTDLPPNEKLNEYDLVVNTDIDLQNVGTVRVKQALLTPNVVNGQLDTIDIDDPGFGYRTVPLVEIEGNGQNAEAVATIDNQGRISSITVTRRGRKYSSIVARIRPFSVLVESDATANGFWSIYSWDDQRRTFFRRKSQAYSVPKYWDYVNWWANDYNELTKISVEIQDFNQEPTLNLQPEDLLRIREFGSGGWAVLERTVDGEGAILGKYNLVGRQNGTIQIDKIVYLPKDFGIGYDSDPAYDTAFYDLSNSKELRVILKAIKENVFIDDLRVEWNKLFFNSVRYAFSEQLYIDWAFKTSFLNAVHSVGELEQRPNYRGDSLDSYRQYLEEVKPYRTTIREYTSLYTRLENTPTAITDFDLPPAYSEVDGEILPITDNFNKFQEYPWKWWTDNNGFSVVDIVISYPGSGYITPPTVVISGNGKGATAEAYVSNGRVSAIRVVNEGVGYTETPMISLVGGNGGSLDTAKAVAVIGGSKVRTFKTSVKFDRLSKDGLYLNFDQAQQFEASGFSSVFELRYAPTRDKTKINVFKNGEIVLRDQYTIQLYSVFEETYTVLKGRLIFNNTPLAGDVIRVEYEKNDSLLDSVNRINKYYAPQLGMKGKELNQLMTGIDFGGVQIQGTTFDVTGGWDALPWFTDNWDSVESNDDFYYAVDFVESVDSSASYKPGSIVEYASILYVCIKENIDSEGNRIIPVESMNWELYWEKFKIQLPFTPLADQPITVYLKKADRIENLNVFSRDSTLSRSIDNLQYAELPSPSRTVRIDDPFFDQYDGSTVQPNGRTTPAPGILMPTIIGDGITNTVDIQEYLILGKNDTLIFRKLDSDGSVTITDINLLDTRISGGTLDNLNNAYTSALGTSAEEIVIDGERFISPDQVPAPEENVPGQVLDSVSIKVYNTTPVGATPINNRVVVSDGVTRIYEIGLTIFETNSVLVYVDKIKQDPSTNYSINFLNNTIRFVSPPAMSSVIEIIAIGIGGSAIIDYQEFLADGDTNLFLTKAPYQQTGSVLVTVDGNFVEPGFINSSEVIDVVDRTMIQFGIKPVENSKIKIVCLGKKSVAQIDSNNLIRVNEQVLMYDGSTRSFELDSFVQLSKASSQSSILVDVNGVQLNNIDTVYVTYDGTNNQVPVGVDPEEPIGTITSGTIKVYINNQLQEFVTDYVFDGNNNLVVISSSALSVGDIIRIEISVKSDYTVSGNILTISQDYGLVENDIVTVIWFSDYPSMNLLTDQYTGGKINYKLSRTPLSSDYIWVYKNGIRLTKDKDFSVKLPQSIVYLTDLTTINDEIKIVQYAREIFQLPVAFEIFKDMLNNYHYKRYSIDNQVKLSKNLNYYDTEISVTDSSFLANPIISRNIPGVVLINGERIDYMVKDGNVLKQLRRGSLGTSIPELHPANSYVIDVGYSETLPYNESQEKFDFIGDGSSQLIGPLPFTPKQSQRESWIRTDIPEEYGPCDEVEVFVAGRRLRKNSISIYNENLGIASPSADETLQAEFSVDGVSAVIRLSEPAPAGVIVSIIRKQGRLWYERGDNSASIGKPLLENETSVVKFIAQKGSELPE